MEKTMSVEEKIRRAEEIYEKRKQGMERNITTVNLNNKKKNIKLFKKMLIQFLICLIIYFIIYTINNNNYIFSKDFIDNTKHILSYDTNFSEIYFNIKEKIQEIFSDKNQKNQEKNEENEENQQLNLDIEKNNNEENSQDAIGGANEEKQVNNSLKLSQEDQDIVDVKNTTTFIKPIEGIITSKYGIRETEKESIPKNHTGIDIAANQGTIIKSATDGEIVLASEEGDYGKHLKIQIGEVSVIYAHCNKLLVKQGEKVVQGQEIAEVGSTGNSTGPHLHFEIRIYERTVDPQNILEL